MKKLVYGGLFLALVGIGFVACEKHETAVSQNVELPIRIDKQELEQIISSINTEEKIGPGKGWWEKVKKWFNDHAGSAQKYKDGQPQCFGSGGCGPCAGICFGGSMSENNDNGHVSEDDYNKGIRSLLFTLIEKDNTYKMLIEIPRDFKNDFIMDELLQINSDELLPAFYTENTDLESVTVLTGVYATSEDSITGNCYSVVDVKVKK